MTVWITITHVFKISLVYVSFKSEIDEIHCRMHNSEIQSFKVKDKVLASKYVTL